MRPMKLAGDQLMFGQNTLKHLTTIKGKKAMIVTSGHSLQRTGIIDKVKNYLKDANMKVDIIHGVEPDPSFSTVLKGKDKMLEFQPDVIVAIGGGSVMDAAKAMWIFYEHPELSSLDELLPPHSFPKLRNKAKMVCIPSTSGSASEVSRSIVITDDKTGFKHGIGNMEMMPDIAICDPEVTLTMPKSLTASTGMDALTHAIEAYTSKRANHLTDILAISAIKDIIEYLVATYEHTDNIDYREKMSNASFIAGLAFTNVSLGIVHSMAHTIGSYFQVPHGLANAILLPYVIEFNMKDKKAKARYRTLEKELGINSIINTIKDMNEKMNIPASFDEVIKNENKYLSIINEMAALSLEDGCTKTNPIKPSVSDFVNILKAAYFNHEVGM